MIMGAPSTLFVVVAQFIGAVAKFAGVTVVPKGMMGHGGYRAGASPAPTIDAVVTPEFG